MQSEMLANIVDSIGQPAIILTANHVLAANDAALQLMGYSATNIDHIKLLKLIHPASRRAALEYYQLVQTHPDTQESISLRLCPADEHPCWGVISLKPAPYAGEGCYLALIRDISREIITPHINPSIIENLPIGIYRTLLDGTIVYANPALAQILGCASVEELKTHRITEFYFNLQDRVQNMAEWLPTQTTFAREILWQRLNGAPIWIQTTGQIIRDNKGNILYLQGSVEDYTEKKLHENHLKQRNHELEILQHIAKSLGASLDVKQTLHTILEQMQQIVPFVSASIFLLHEGKLEFLADMGIPPEAKARIIASAPTFGTTPRLMAESAENIMLIPDVAQDADWQTLPGMEYVRSWMGIALRYQNDVIGIMNLDHDEANFYNENHVRYAKAVAGQAAIAIANARLYEQAQGEIEFREQAQNILIDNLINTETLYWVLRHLFEAEKLDEVLPHVLNMLSTSLDHTSLILVAFEPESGQLLHLLQSDNATLDIWQTFQTISGYSNLPPKKMPPRNFDWLDGHNYQFADGRKAFCATVWERGMLAAVREDANSADFSQGNVELLITVANQLSIALAHEEYNNRLHDRSQQLQRLADNRANQLHLEQKRQAAILDATAEGIFYMENFRIEYANPAFCRMVGYSLEELYGKPLSFIRVSPDAPERPNFNNLLDDKLEVEPERSETRLRHRDGTEFYANIRFSIIGQPGNDMHRMVAIARDISQERELYFQRARFIANAAHELRTPLSSLMLRMHMMKRQPEKVLHHLESLDAVVNFLKHLVEELLDLSRFERGTIELDRNHFDLQKLIQQAADSATPFAQEQSITLDLVLPDEQINIHADGNRLVQLFENLIINGINYNTAGGNVAVKGVIEVDHVGNRSVIIEVIDNGVGIASELLPSQIFEPFARPSEGTRRETGMGLAICREVVHLHGGTIHARSTQGQGSTFRIMLPLE
jgi:PAS domain S-box-containing protein